jgi:polysaccharide biosynthesis protein PslG
MAEARAARAFRPRLLGAVVAALLAIVAFPASALALPAGFWGVVPQSFPTTEQLQRLHRGGVDSLRIPIGWPSVQPNQGAPFDWSGIDHQVAEASRAGIGVLPFFSGAPEWAVPSIFVSGTGRSAIAPAHLPVSGAARTGWASFVSAAVARYGPSGSFWSENPGVPKRPVRVWQIWNEPNFKYFVAKPNPTEYGKLVKASYSAIKAGDPGAKVVLAGLFARPKGGNTSRAGVHNWFATRFLDKMYQTTPGLKKFFDGVALHPYTAKYQYLQPEIEAFRNVLTAHHDGGKGLWLTELGWSSGPPASDGSNSFAKGPAGQVAQLRGAFGLLTRNQVKWKVQRIYWFSVDDARGACNFCDGSGLFGEGFKPKRSWYAYVKFAGGKP